MNTQRVMLSGREYSIPKGMTAKDFMNRINLNRDGILVAQGDEFEPSQILERNSRLPNKSKLNLVTLPRYIQGFNSHTFRIKNEMQIISMRFPVSYDPSNIDYITVLDFPLNQNYNFKSTTLLIQIPERYPFTPPEHFYVKQNLLYKGKSPKHYFQNAGFNDLENLGWSKYCLHVKSWEPSQDIISGDSLITFLELIKVVFDNIEREGV